MSNLRSGISTAFQGIAGALLAVSTVLVACGQSADRGGGTSPLPGARDDAAPAENGAEPALMPAQSSTPAPTSANDLCDGSPGVRVAHFSTEGYAEDDPYWFGEEYGPSFLAIDGTCRIWTATSNSGEVFTGVLPSVVAEEFASAIGFGHQASWPGMNDGCELGATPRMSLWTEAGTTFCCDCSDDIEQGTQWGLAMNALLNERLQGAMLSEHLEPVAGPARLALVPMSSPSADAEPALWPLSRAPADGERLPVDEVPDATWLAFDWGARVTDHSELALLRATRATRRDGEVWQYTPLLWIPPGRSEAEPLQMLLQDEIPDAVARAVALARRPPQL